MTSSAEPKTPKKSLRNRFVSSLKTNATGTNKKDDRDEDLETAMDDDILPLSSLTSPRTAQGQQQGSGTLAFQSPRVVEDDSKKKRRGEGFVGRMRSLSRSRSRSASRKSSDHANGEQPQKTIVTVTSCRSDGYYNQKAPGSTSKLPRKAPTNLKLFHELAVGIKDAYAAVGQTPIRPILETDEITGHPNMSEKEFQSRNVLWEFIGNIDFLLALVDEVAVDTATRGALKDDTTFKGLRDVIKKCNKVLEDMLVRRERRYTLFFRLVMPEDAKEIERIKTWNDRVEKAVGAVTSGESDAESFTDGTDGDSDASSITSSGTVASKGSLLARGRQLLPVAGRVRARRATPTPKLRSRDSNKENSNDPNAAEDGFAASTPITSGNLAALQQSFQKNARQGGIPQGLTLSDPAAGASGAFGKQQLAVQPQVAPKDELVDVIRGLRMEKMKNREGTQESDLQALKPDWRPKADIPSAVPKLPVEYIHRHRLMKQVVSCMLDQTVSSPEEENTDVTPIITSITSRHGDKAGNGKTTLAVASIQTVEVRERFSDGIAWITLGRGPLIEKDIRRLYEELYRQLFVKDGDLEVDDDHHHLDKKRSESPSGNHGPTNTNAATFDGTIDGGDKDNKKDTRKGGDEGYRHRLLNSSIQRRRFQSGELDGIKEEIARMISKKKILICLDDVWRVEDAKWFIFDNQILNGNKTSKQKMKPRLNNTIAPEEYPGRILMTTRSPSLLGNSGLVQEVFVRILSEHEAVKLLLSTAGRRPYGGKNSAVFNQAKLIVKGCGNSPLAVRLAGSTLRQSSRSWNINSPAWSSLIRQARLNLEEASQLRSFINAVNRVVDLSFFTVADVRTRIVLRRCFVAYAMAFRENDWMLSGRGIPQSVVLRVFQTIISADEGNKYISASSILDMLEKLNLLERARHGWHTRGGNFLNPVREALIKNQTQRAAAAAAAGGGGGATGTGGGIENETDSDWDDEDEGKVYRVQQLFVMHDSLKAVAEEMAKRTTSALSPDADDFASYLVKIEEEKKISRESDSLWTAPLRFLTQQFNQNTGISEGFQGGEAHKLVVTSLLDIGDGMGRSGSVSEALMAGQIDMAVIAGGEKMEEYMSAFLPWHLMKCEAYSSAAEILSDSHFIGRRVHSLGIIEATSRQVADLQELRRLAPTATFSIPGRNVHESGSGTGAGANGPGGADTTVGGSAKYDVNAVVRDGSRITVDEVFRAANKQAGRPDSLGMAMCLAAIGEGLLKSRQPRDAMLRLEESVNIFKGLLGTNHPSVADALHTSAKALVKVGETRVALLKFAEAARIYEACSATLHYNSIANAQSLASLLVDLGDIEKAQSMFEEVIAMRKSVYGVHCVPVAKTINAYAILLAKHGRMNNALQNYEAAKQTYDLVPLQLVRDPEYDIKCKYDVTLINLNIASIRSKKGDLQAAITCYEEGVQGLREYEMELIELQKDPYRAPDNGRNTAHKHLIAALGRIGSLKLKIGDNEGALKAYMTLLQEVKEDSPSASQTEKAKAHIKCATIFRQQENTNAHTQSISHLRQALDMYTVIFGPDHKDTAAIASSLRQWLAEDQQS